MVTDPAAYKWSSYGAQAFGNRDLVVDQHPFYSSMGASEQERQKAYAEYVLNTIPEYEIKFIRDALQRGQLTGSDRFRVEVEKKLGIRISNKIQGRPRKMQEK